MQLLLATDGSDCARAALEFTLRFPFPQGSTVTVLTVFDESALREEHAEQLSEEHHDLLRETVESVREEGEQLVESEQQRFETAGWQGVKTLVRTGNPAEEVIRSAEELGSDLVIVGSHGWTGIQEFLLGSVSHKVLQHAPCSVLVVKQPHPQKPLPDSGESGWRILVAYDDSAPAKKAVQLCASLPLEANTEVNVVGVLPMVTLYRQDIRQRLDPIWQHKKQVLRTALENTVNAADWSTSAVSTELHEATDASQAILDAAANTDANLIMLGTKGKGAIKRFLLGSMTHHVTRHAACSVWAVHE
jgi:nucleotide-binding universal stress UspA family protein